MYFCCVLGFTGCDITDEKYRSFIETVRSELESMVNNGKKLKVGINNIKYYFIKRHDIKEFLQNYTKGNVEKESHKTGLIDIKVTKFCLREIYTKKTTYGMGQAQ